MTDMEWNYLCELARRLANGIKIPKEMENRDFAEAFAWMSDRYFLFARPRTDEKGSRLPFWRRGKFKQELFRKADSEAFTASLQAETAKVERMTKERMQQERAKVGMFDFVESVESTEAEKQLKELEARPFYDGQHRDIVRWALKAGKPVPCKVVADYLDEPWATQELARRVRHLGMAYFERTAQNQQLSESPKVGDYPQVSGQFIGRRGKPLLVQAIYQENPWVTVLMGRPFLCLVDVFPTITGARQYLDAHLPIGDHRIMLHLQELAIAMGEGELQVSNSAKERLDLEMSKKALSILEARLQNN